MRLLGVDTGGTFTDFVLYDNGRLTVHKVLSIPQAPDQAILQGINELGVALAGLKVIHGSTVATNAVLESKGVKTVYVANYGLKDVLHIGRQARRELYNLCPTPIQHPLAPELCLETGGRLSAQGEIIDDLSSSEIKKLVDQIADLAPQAVAINLLFSFLDSRFEQQIKAALPDTLFVSCSSDILPEYKEYERGMTTWLNAYVGPLVGQYLQRLNANIAPAKLSVMLSAGGTASAEVASRKAVHMLLSGPAGGLQAAKYIGQQLNRTNLLTLDMGGTSTDVALIDGDFKLSNESIIANLPVAVPMVDMHTIGAGGGSIAKIDEGGLLRVGPESAGAVPGPACYQNGGQHATVTDANVVLGRLPVEVSLGGSLNIDLASAKRAISAIASGLNCSLESAALGIIKITNEHMAQALRVISVQKGIDPREYSLMSFGGAGGLHVCDLAESMDMKEAIVPNHAGVLSAFGMIIAPIGRELSKTCMGVLVTMSAETISGAFEVLAKQGIAEMLAEGIRLSEIQRHDSMDLRYQGQSFALNIPWGSDAKVCFEQGIEQAILLFNETHALRYGHNIDEVIELVNVRVSLKSPTPSLNWQQTLEKPRKKPTLSVSLHALGQEVPVWLRENIMPGEIIHGPALIEEAVTTTLVKPRWSAKMNDGGHLILTFAGHN